MIYFDWLPSDLYGPLLHYFSLAELVKVLETLRTLPTFNTFFTSLWKNNISTITNRSIDLYITDYFTITKAELISYLARNGYDKLLYSIPDCHKYYLSIVMEATIVGHITIIKKMLENMAELNRNYHTNACNEVLNYAASDGNMKIITFIIGHAEIHNKILDYNWPMAFAAWHGHIDVVKFMIKCGANNFDQTLLYAKETGHGSIVEFMKTHGAKEIETH